MWKYLWHGGVQLVMYLKVATASDLRTYLHMCHLRSQEDAAALMMHMKMSLMPAASLHFRILERHSCYLRNLSRILAART